MYERSPRKTLWRSPSDQAYLTCSHDSFDLSPVYVTAAAARGLIQGGVLVELPVDYTVNSLDNIAWMTGAYGKTVNVSDRQAREVAEIALTLMRDHKDALTPSQLAGASTVVRVVQSPDDAATRE